MESEMAIAGSSDAAVAAEMPTRRDGDRRAISDPKIARLSSEVKTQRALQE
jgi:hypothetical protein